ncbi:F-box/kelch-repeat protein-like [Dorcoceras hygrometricum]|uniref:F-box/kelch-repeat protein-like n=1 Tax=Dorcoceras hygrometricum TaxID=472368 RepID=A0A2Z7BQV2_9LAMI|nr:F-box/kelch-repeat protein-like [Dorcoceras hygrometricum]
MSASGESSTTKHRLLHASGSHPIPPPDDPKIRDLALIPLLWNRGGSGSRLPARQRKNKIRPGNVQYNSIMTQYEPFIGCLGSYPAGDLRLAPTGITRRPALHDSIGYPPMSASGESSTTKYRLLHASGSHSIPPPDDSKKSVWSVRPERKKRVRMVIFSTISQGENTESTVEDETGAGNQETFMEARTESAQQAQQSTTYTGKSVYASIEIREINLSPASSRKLTQLIKSREFYLILIIQTQSRNTTCWPSKLYGTEQSAKSKSMISGTSSAMVTENREENNRPDHEDDEGSSQAGPQQVFVSSPPATLNADIKLEEVEKVVVSLDYKAQDLDKAHNIEYRNQRRAKLVKVKPAQDIWLHWLRTNQQRLKKGSDRDRESDEKLKCSISSIFRSSCASIQVSDLCARDLDCVNYSSKVKRPDFIVVLCGVVLAVSTISSFQRYGFQISPWS